MLRQASTTAMVGRQAELGAFRDAFAVSLEGRPQWVLIGGEAGIGKTRLVAEFTAGLAAGSKGAPPVVVIGQCIDLGDAGAPFQSAKEIVRGLVHSFGIEVTADAAGNRRSALAVLLPDLGAPDGDPEELRDATAAVVETLSAARPLAIVIEDAHWIDPATAALLRGLVRLLRDGRVVLALTYRSEQVGRAHPLRPLLADLDRRPHVSRIELEPLTRDEVAEQAGGLLGGTPDVDVLARIYDRSEGVPFFVEELARLEGRDEELPDTVRTTVLAGYDRLAPPIQRMLRLVAVGGMSVDHDIVAGVFDGGPEALDEAARHAVGAHVLVRSPDRYVFRHALIRDAILDELVPGERGRNHARYAEVLSQRPAGRWAEIAHHWLAAHHTAKVFTATLAAIPEARAAGALASAAALGERAIGLWPQIANAAEIAGADRMRTLHDLAWDCYEAGQAERAIEVIDTALAELGSNDTVAELDLMFRKSWVQSGLGDPGAEVTLGVVVSRSRTLTDHAGRALYAEARVSLAHRRAWQDGDLADASILASEAAHDAWDIGELEVAARAHVYAGLSAALRGDLSEAGVLFCQARAADPTPTCIGRLAIYQGVVLNRTGDHQGAVQLATEALQGFHTQGAVRARFGPVICANAAEGYLGLGQPAEAERLIAEGLGLIPLPPDELQLLLRRLRLLIWRDELDEAKTLDRRLRAEVPEHGKIDVDLPPLVGRASAELALACAEVRAAWEIITPVLASSRVLPDRHIASPATAAAALAGLRRAGAPPEPDPEPQLYALMDRCSVWPIAEDWQAVVDAELSGPLGTGTDVSAWAAAVAAADRGRLDADRRVYTRMRLAEAQVLAGERDAAAETLDMARDLGESFGALRLLREISELAQRAGLAAPHHHRAAGDPEALTARERQVLELIAEGLSNKQIGQRLFISTKTASVHVSAILRKIGVATRTEAAVLARDPVRGLIPTARPHGPGSGYV